MFLFLPQSTAASTRPPPSFCYLGEHPHVQNSKLLPVSPLIAAGGSAWQSWRWWPCCLSLHGRACWGPYRSPCKQKTRRHCSCWAAKSLWICIRRRRLSRTEKPGERTREGRSVNLLTVVGMNITTYARFPYDLYFGRQRAYKACSGGNRRRWHVVAKEMPLSNPDTSLLHLPLKISSTADLRSNVS